MLSEHTITIVKTNTPLLKEHGEAIAARVYTLLFEKYPQTKPLFNRAPPNQPQKLAQSIIAYCDSIDNLPALSNALDRIAHKHVVVDVHPGHYAMMGQALSQAIKEVLGTQISDEVLHAWKEAYFHLADLLIERERTLITQKKR